jgi:hypothetical protein
MFRTRGGSSTGRRLCIVMLWHKAVIPNLGYEQGHLGVREKKIEYWRKKEHTSPV